MILTRSGLVQNVVVSALAALIGGCRGAPASSDQGLATTASATATSALASAGGQNGACSLVTAAAASAALGATATNDESKSAGASSRCTYEASSGSVMVIVSDQGRAPFDRAHAAAAGKGPHSFAELSGIGDGAFATFGGPMASVMFLKGSFAVTIILTVQGLAAPPLDKASALAKAAAGRV